MSSELKSTSRARFLPMRRGNRAMGPPPATRPTPTSHCDRTARSRLAKLMSHARAISLPFPVARPPDRGDRHEGRSSQAHEDVRPRFETGRPLRQVGQILELGEEVGVIQKIAFDSTFKDHDLHILVSFELRHDLLELHDELRPHQIQWRVVEYDAAIGWQLPGQPHL